MASAGLDVLGSPAIVTPMSRKMSELVFHAEASAETEQ